jgi:hypothetical protein
MHSDTQPPHVAHESHHVADAPSVVAMADDYSRRELARDIFSRAVSARLEKAGDIHETTLRAMWATADAAARCWCASEVEADLQRRKDAAIRTVR